MSVFDNITNPFEDKEVIRKIIDIYCNARVDNETKEIYDADGLYKRITDYGKETENSQNEYISKFDRYIRLPNLDKLYANIGLEDFEAFDKQVEEIQRGIESRPISDTEKQGMIRELHKKTMYPLSRFKMLFDEFNSFSDIEKIYNEKRFAYIENILIYLDIYPSHKEEYMQQLQEFGLTEEEQIQKIDILTIFRRKMNNRFYGGEGVMGFHVNPQSLQVYDREENVEKGEMKLYINAGTDTYKFASLFQERCEELGLNYYFKVAHAYEEAEYKRNDKMCIFTERKDAEKFLEVIQQVKEENPDIILKSPPLLAGKIEGNIGVGMDNISSKGKSYNQEMSTICFETIKQFFKGMPREQIPEYIKANPQVIEQLQSEMIAKVQNTGLSELFQKKKTKGQGEQTTDLEDLLTERLEESSTESLEELSTEKLEELLRTTQEQNKSKKSELEQLLKKQMLIEKIIQAQEEGKQLDRQIAEARAKLAQKEGEEYHE